jgi:hypothetical protein
MPSSARSALASRRAPRVTTRRASRGLRAAGSRNQSVCFHFLAGHLACGGRPPPPLATTSALRASVTSTDVPVQAPITWVTNWPQATGGWLGRSAVHRAHSSPTRPQQIVPSMAARTLRWGRTAMVSSGRWPDFPGSPTPATRPHLDGGTSLTRTSAFPSRRPGATVQPTKSPVSPTRRSSNYNGAGRAATDSTRPGWQTRPGPVSSERRSSCKTARSTR